MKRDEPIEACDRLHLEEHLIQAHACSDCRTCAPGTFRAWQYSVLLGGEVLTANLLYAGDY